MIKEKHVVRWIRIESKRRRYLSEQNRRLSPWIIILFLLWFWKSLVWPFKLNLWIFKWERLRRLRCFMKLLTFSFIFSLIRLNLFSGLISWMWILITIMSEIYSKINVSFFARSMNCGHDRGDNFLFTSTSSFLNHF